MLAHEQRLLRAEESLRFEDVVSPTPELQIVRRRFTAGGIRNDVVKFEKPGLIATTRRANEGTAAAITCPHGAFHGCGDATRARDLRASSARPLNHRQLGFCQVVEKNCERAIEDDGRVAVRDLMSQQILRATQLVVRVVTNGELHFVTLRRKRRDDWWGGSRTYERG